jgi:hypothetical protein
MLVDRFGGAAGLILSYRKSMERKIGEAINGSVDAQNFLSDRLNSPWNKIKVIVEAPGCECSKQEDPIHIGQIFRYGEWMECPECKGVGYFLEVSEDEQ